MGERTGISWTDATWNPVRGCSMVSAGCTHCYAMRQAGRMAGKGQAYEGLVRDGKWTGTVRLVPEHLADPLRWRKPRRVFVNSMSDLFHEALSDAQIAEVFSVMSDCAAFSLGHAFQVLTKRPARMRAWFESSAASDLRWQTAQLAELDGRGSPGWPLPNIWLGVSCEDQATADDRIPLLLQTPAAVRWLSVEPMLGPVDLTAGYGLDVTPDGDARELLDWCVVGAESGAGHRPLNLDWLAALVGQCRDAGIPAWVKQDSGAKPGQQGRIPDHLWIHEWPRAAEKP